MLYDVFVTDGNDIFRAYADEEGQFMVFRGLNKDYADALCAVFLKMSMEFVIRPYVVEDSDN